MDQSKIENFKKTYPRRDFPKFEELAAKECQEVQRNVGDRLGLDEGASGLELLQALHDRGGLLVGEVPSEGSPDLRGLLRDVFERRRSHVLVNWYRFDEIDRIDLDCLARHFDDVWYPAVDDIEIFDESCSWFLLVSHDGVIRFISLL